jgi:hypothetical protein
MMEHRAAVSEKLVDQEADGLRKLNLGRDQILTRLWELATLSHEATRGTIAGQIKALSMIVAIEGLVPDRRFCQPSAPPIHSPDWLRKQQHEPASEEPGDPVAARKTQPAAPQVPDPELDPRPTPEPAPNRPTAGRSPTSTGNQPALSIPLSTPHPRATFPPQPASPLTPSWTGSTPSGCPSHPIDASLGGGAEVVKRSNFIEFYEISRSRPSDKTIKQRQR